jgi:hypothetical protein
MFLATIVIVVALSQNGAAPQAATPQPAQQENTKPESSSAPQQNQNPQTASPKPCPAGAKQGSSSTPDCPPKKKKAKKPATTETPAAATDGGPSKTVIRNGSTAEPSIEIAPSVNEQQASRESRQTNQLLATTEANLKTVSSRTLNATQQDTVKQIRNYMDQARAAEGDGDLQRAYNLANKAKMLSADLVGH